jgi:hypothetical protein
VVLAALQEARALDLAVVDEHVRVQSSVMLARE